MFFQFILFIVYVGCKVINLKKIFILYVLFFYLDIGIFLFFLKVKLFEQLVYDIQSKFVYVVGKCLYFFVFLLIQCNEFEKKSFQKKDYMYII